MKLRLINKTRICKQVAAARLALIFGAGLLLFSFGKGVKNIHAKKQFDRDLKSSSAYAAYMEDRNTNAYNELLEHATNRAKSNSKEETEKTIEPDDYTSIALKYGELKQKSDAVNLKRNEAGATAGIVTGATMVAGGMIGAGIANMNDKKHIIEHYIDIEGYEDSDRRPRDDGRDM